MLQDFLFLQNPSNFGPHILFCSQSSDHSFFPADCRFWVALSLCDFFCCHPSFWIQYPLKNQCPGFSVPWPHLLKCSFFLNHLHCYQDFFFTYNCTDHCLFPSSSLTFIAPSRLTLQCPWNLFSPSLLFLLCSLPSTSTMNSFAPFSPTHPASLTPDEIQLSVVSHCGKKACRLGDSSHRQFMTTNLKWTLSSVPEA